MTPHRTLALLRCLITRIMCLALIAAVVSMPPGAHAAAGQIGGPVLTVYVEPSSVVPGQSVTFTVIASGAGSFAAINVDVPNELTISQEVDCVHNTLYCDGSSISTLDADTNRLSVTAPGALPGPDGPSPTVRVTITFSVLVPAMAVPGTQYEVVSSVAGLFNRLDPTSETDKRITTVLEVLDASGQRVPLAPISEDSEPYIQISKKRCEGRDTFPVFVESHCVDMPDSLFALSDPRNLHVETFSSGDRYVPEKRLLAGSNLWTLDDISSDPTPQGVRVVSCLESEPSSNWRSSVPRVVQPDEPGTVVLDWMFAGVPNQTYQPSLDCVWLELPDIDTVPAVLSVQVFTAESPYLNWTELTGPRLPDLARGESGEDLEADLEMTNIDTGDVYSFAADAYGQVLVPSGTYSLVETTSGLESYFFIGNGQTILVEVGLAETIPIQSAPESNEETATFLTGALHCVATGCSAVEGVTISYASIDGSVQGTCVTEFVQTPNGETAWCSYEFIPGMPTILTLDESTLPAEWVLTSENPQTYLVPENPDGPLGPVYFELEPA